MYVVTNGSSNWEHYCRVGGNSFLVEASQVTEMLEGNIITPYKFRKVVLFFPKKASLLQVYSTLFSLNNKDVYSCLF